IGLLAFRRKLTNQVGTEELRDRWYVLFFDRDFRHVERRLDAEHRDAPPLVELQQIAVVTRDFDHQALPVQATGLDQLVSELFRVLEHGVGERREVEIIAEERLRRNGLGDLQQRTGTAEGEVQRVGRLRLLELRLGEQRVGERRLA